MLGGDKLEENGIVRVSEVILAGHKKRVTAMSWSHDGRRLLSCSSDRLARVWTISYRDEQRPSVTRDVTLSAHREGVECGDWERPALRSASGSSGSMRAVTGSKDRTIRVWDASKGRVLVTFECSREPVCLAWRPGGDHIAYANSNDEVGFVDASSGDGKARKGKCVCDAEINEIAWLPDSAGPEGLPERLAIASGTKSVEIVAFPGLELLRSLGGHTSTLYCLSVTPDGSRLASGAADTFVCLWDTEDLYSVGCVGSLATPPKSVSYASDGSHVAVAHDVQGVSICDGGTGEAVAFMGAPSDVSLTLWHPKRNVIAYVDAGDKEKGEFPIRVTGFRFANS